VAALAALTILSAMTPFFSTAAEALGGEPVTVVPCNAPVGQGDLVAADGTVHPGSLGVVVPSAVPEVGNTRVLGDEGACAEAYRTLMFVADMSLSNGLNFAGSYNAVDTSGGTAAVTGTYDFPFSGGPNICVLVDWQNGAAAATVPIVSSCTVSQSTAGSYGGPGADGQTAIIKRHFADAANGGEPQPRGNPIGNRLHWDPANQPSCFDSDGRGYQRFVAYTAGGGVQVWDSSDSAGNTPVYLSWDNGLDHLRGHVTQDGERAYEFDAKLEVHAAPNAQYLDSRADIWDNTDSGCMQKTEGYSNLDLRLIGLNDLDIAGTATWQARTPMSAR
jgi:hypothetical protein